MTVSLNRKRRIFRQSVGSHVRPVGRMRPGALTVAIGGTVTVAAAVWLFVSPSHAPALPPASSEISAPFGDLAVVDGDTLRIGHQIVRLRGIAAPARGDRCGPEDCGAAAANALASRIRGQSVVCRIDGHDPQGRPLGTCLSSGVQLNQAQVRDGWARAEAAALRETESDARAAKRGIWQQGL